MRFKRWLGFGPSDTTAHIRKEVRTAVHYHRNLAAQAIHEARRNRQRVNRALTSAEEAIQRLEESRDERDQQHG
jgi:hypothetical protein